MSDLLVNFAYTTLAASIASTDTTIPVSDTARIPTNAQLAANDFYMEIESPLSVGNFELVKVTAKSTTSGAGNLTVARGVEGTTAAAHPSGVYLKGTLTAGMLSRLASAAGAMAYQGAWTATTYPAGSVVTRGDSIYVASTSTTATDVPPSTRTKTPTLYVYGHSIAAGLGASDTTHRWGYLTAAALGLIEANRAVSGTTAKQIFEDFATGATVSTVLSPPLAKGSVVAIQAAANTERLYGASAELEYTHVMRGMAAFARAKTRIFPASFTTSGSWTAYTYNRSTSGTALGDSGVAGNYAETTFTGDHVNVLGIVDSLNNGGDATVSYSIDGTVVRTVTYPASLAVSGDGSEYGHPHTCERLTGLGSGTHTLRITQVAGTMWYLDSATIDQSPAPVVAFVAENYSASYTTGNQAAPYNNSSNAIVDAYNAILDSVAAEFADGRVIVTRTTGWNPAVDDVDDLHPNDTGHALIAASVEAALTPFTSATATSPWKVLVPTGISATGTKGVIPPVGSGTASLWQLNGVATHNTTTSTQLTTTAGGQAGNVLLKTPIDLDGLDVSFQTEASGGSGADGYAVLFFDADEESYTSFGGAAREGGYDGVKGTALHWETYNGVATGLTVMVVDAHGTSTTALTSSPIVSDTDLRAPHNWRIRATRVGAETYAIRINKDGGSYVFTTIPAPPIVYFGFGAGTGGSTDNHYVRNVTGTYGR